MKYQKIVEYWITTAEHDFDVMKVLFENKKYDQSLFFGHIILEKILKAHVVNRIKKPAPFTHHLMKLHDLAELNLEEEEKKLLYDANEFNMSARYPEYKFTFYKKCTKKFSEACFIKIVALYNKLCQKIKREK